MNNYMSTHVPSRGFTLVETLVAISILLVAIVGPMTIAADGLQNTFYAREQVTAYMLAQEGMELVRAARDQNALADSAWLAGIASACATSNADGCGIDVRDAEDLSGSFFDCAGTACQLHYDDGSLAGNRGFYTYEVVDEPTQFTRRIWIEEVVGDREAEVTVEVTWATGVLSGGEQTVTIQSRLFNHFDSI